MWLFHFYLQTTTVFQLHRATREAQKAFILGLQRALRLSGAKVAEDVAAPVGMFPHMSPEPEAKGSGGTGQMGEACAVYAPVANTNKNPMDREHLFAGVAAVDDTPAMRSKAEGIVLSTLLIGWVPPPSSRIFRSLF